MVGLVDIAPATETVAVHGKAIEVHGVSVKGPTFLGASPSYGALMSGREVDANGLMALAPDAIAAIIAAGAGYPSDRQAEEVFGRLSIDAQADVLHAILKLTLPKGVGPFVEKLTAMGELLNSGAVVSTTTPDMSLPRQSKL